MGPLVGETELTEALLQAGNDLLNLHFSTDAIFDLLNKVESLLLAVDQDPIIELKNALKPSMQALVSADLLRNPDSDVRVYVVSCLTEIMRITAPEAPYNDDQMKEVFEVTVEAFGKLADASCESYKKAEAVLDTVAKVRSSLVMLDLECDDLILEMFRQFLKIIRISPDCPQTVLYSMETIMVTVIDESEEVSMELLEILLAPVKKESLDVSPVATRLVEKVLIGCACRLRPDIMEALKSTGTSLDMYSPVVSSICQSESTNTEAHIVVKPKETEVDEKISEEQVVPSEPLQEKLDVGLSPKGTRSKRTARSAARTNGDDNVKHGDGLKQLLKQGQSESTDGETESGSTRTRKPNSLINPEEGYSFKTSSSKKVQEKELGDSSLVKLAAKKGAMPSEAGQTKQSVVISLSPSSKAWKGSRKRSRSKMEETVLDASTLATPASKKHNVKKDEPEEKEDLMETDLEQPEDSAKTVKSSKKEKAQKGSAKTTAKKPLGESKKEEKAQKGPAKAAAKKPLAESKKEIEQKSSAKTSAKKPLAESKKETEQKSSAKTSAKKALAESKKEIEQNGLAKTSAKKPLEKLVHSDAKKKNSEGASKAESSKSKKKSSRAMTPSNKESEQSLKSHPKRKRTALEEVEPSKSEHGEELVGKRVKVWWPLDKKFYDGVIKSYNSLKKMHEVLYSDGDSEKLNLEKERWEIISEEKEEIDLPDSTPLSDIMRRHKAKKRKMASMNVEPKSSSEVRSSKKKDLVTNSTKQGKGTKDAVKGGSNEPERREERNLEISKESDDKEEPETKGEDTLKIEKESNAEPECKRDQQESPEESNAVAKSGEELKSANKSTAETETDGKEQEAEKESTAELNTDGEEREAVKEPNEEPETEVQMREEITAVTKLVVEDPSEEKESGKVEVEPEEEEQKIVEGREEETDKVEGGTIPVSG